MMNPIPKAVQLKRKHSDIVSVGLVALTLLVELIMDPIGIVSSFNDGDDGWISVDSEIIQKKYITKMLKRILSTGQCKSKILALINRNPAVSH
jgi:hypothetical protein